MRHVLRPYNLRRGVIVDGSTLILSLDEVDAALKSVLVNLIVESIAVLPPPELLELRGRRCGLFTFKIDRTWLAANLQFFSSSIDLVIFFIVS